MEISVDVPLDDDGYVDRECPNCERPFRWRYGPSSETARTNVELTQYHCPYCGIEAAADQWWTREQVQHMQASAMAAYMPEVEHQLRQAANGLNRTGFLETKVNVSPPAPPTPLFVDDVPTTAVASPCHPDEPVKLIGELEPSIHCLVCGREYTI